MLYHEEEELFAELKNRASASQTSALQTEALKEVRAINAAVLDTTGGRNRAKAPDTELRKFNAALRAVDPAGGEWEVFHDRDQGMAYYHNSATGEATWTHPAAPLEGNAFAKHGRQSIHASNPFLRYDSVVRQQRKTLQEKVENREAENDYDEA